MSHSATEKRIRAYASSRDGVISRAILRRFGLSDSQIARRVRSGALVRLHRGIYVLGGAPVTLRARVRAALLAGGPGAVACRSTALALWDLGGEPPVVEILVRGRNPGSLRGVRVHRTQRPLAQDVRLRHGFRCTSPSRTICDLAAQTPRRELERWIQELTFRKLLGKQELEGALEAMRGLPGAPALRALVAREAGAGFTRSGLERRFLQLVQGAGLPRPEKNVEVEGFTVDCLWRRERVIVEIDDESSHGSAASFHGDRQRDAALTAAGWRVLRFTGPQLRGAPLLVVARLSAVLLQLAP